MTAQPQTAQPLTAQPLTAQPFTAQAAAVRLRVDWPSCKAHGLCAELVPELIRLDEWGFPVLDPAGVSDRTVEAARRAVSACPTLALRLVDPPR